MKKKFTEKDKAEIQKIKSAKDKKLKEHHLILKDGNTRICN